MNYQELREAIRELLEEYGLEPCPLTLRIEEILEEILDD